MRRFVFFLISFIPMQIFAQVPDIKVRVYNNILVLKAMLHLDVPLYLDSLVNSHRTYSWYETRTSFGVRSKSSEIPWRTIDCQYNQGRLTAFIYENITYILEWDGDYINHITKYNSKGEKIVKTSGLKDRSPTYLHYKLFDFHYRKNWNDYNPLCFFDGLYGSNGKEVTGNYFRFSELNDGGVSLEEISFHVKTKAFGWSYYNDQDEGSFKSDKYGRCYTLQKRNHSRNSHFVYSYYHDDTLHFKDAFIEEVSIQY